jgi:uncharacterized protein YbbK (DUF523 family)
MSMRRSGRPRVGISACLLGDKVRYDGSHKRDAFLVEVVGPQVEWVRVCPEVEVGMGTPRETLHLVRENGRVRMKTTETALDYTDAMEEWAERRVKQLAGEDLSGYVLKKNSPSCGLDGVAIDDSNGRRADDGRGLFADVLMRRFPDLPMEDEARLSQPEIRDAFVRRVFEYWRNHD